jgi:hypothetical protein
VARRLQLRIVEKLLPVVMGLRRDDTEFVGSVSPSFRERGAGTEGDNYVK